MPTRRAARRRAFSLLEMMLVLLIMGTLVGIVAVNFAARNRKAQIDTTRIKIREIANALGQYEFEKAALPTTSEGLGVLVPNYLKTLHTDAWKQPFLYYCPTTDPNRPFQIISAGPDRQPGTEDDITSWDVETN